GKMELAGSPQACQRAQQLLDSFRRSRQPIVFIQHVAARPGASFFLPDTTGVEIHPTIKPQPGETVFQKHYPNSFRETPLLDHLRADQISRLLICGMMTHMCVDATVRAAYDFGFQCLVAGDACATRDLQFDGQKVPADYVHRSFLAALNGTYADVMDSSAVLAAVE
ncbi:MAG: cysteine hydrolase family protein, partial [Anaerolineales bacterium]